MKTYPLMTLSRFLYWKIVKRIKFIRPFWYIEHSKEKAREFLEKILSGNIMVDII